ncbi:MAG: IclR family transcriptional regulator [Actinobacteria bacterium]|nr:IclR family transcriptional regulator [Actinomycetota bacterium]
MSAPSSLSQGLTLLESAVARERSGRTGHNASRLAEATGIERSRVSRLTTELRALHFLERDEAGVLSAGDAYFRTAAALEEPWLRAARQELRTLASTLRMTALLAAADGAKALLLRSATGVGSTDAAVPYGITPIWCTGAGRALLWDHSLPCLEETLREVRFVGIGGPAAARTIDEVQDLMDRDRSAGMIVASDEYAEGVTELALPIRGRSGIVASVAVSGARRGAGPTRAARTALAEVRDRLSALATGQ